MFAGPHKLVQKRFDKLLDFHTCTERVERLKDKRTLEELQSARNNYEALNTQLLDELPKFQCCAKELFTSCLRSYAEAHCDFVRLALQELQPLLSVSTETVSSWHGRCSLHENGRKEHDTFWFSSLSFSLLRHVFTEHTDL